MGSFLVPRKRVDKNGRVITRHMKDEQDTNVGKNIPAPSLDEAHKPIELTYKQKARLPRGFDNPAIVKGASEELAQGSRRQQYFSCSDEEFYMVMEYVSPNDAILMLDAGVRVTERGIQKFIKKRANQNILVDNKELVYQLKSRQINCSDYVTAAFDNKYPDAPQSLVLDAAEYLSMSDENTSSYLTQNTLYHSILSGSVLLSDVKILGKDLAHTIHQSTNGQLLKRLANGKSLATARDISHLVKYNYKGLEVSGVDNFNTNRWAPDYRTKSDMINHIWSAVICGFEDSDEMNYELVADSLETIEENDLSPEEGARFASYFNELFEGDPEGYRGRSSSSFEFFEAEIPASFVREHYDYENETVSVQQVIGMYNGINPSISGGFL